MRFTLPIGTNSSFFTWRGFTMVESLIVLLVVSIFIFLPLIAIDRYQAYFEVWGFCARLEKGLAVAQQTAIIDARETKVAYSDSPVPTIYFHSTITGEIKMEPLEVPSQLAVRVFPVLTFTSQWTKKKRLPTNFFLEVDDMIRSSNKGYIMLESIIGFGLLTTSVFLFLTVQTHILQQSAQLQAQVAAIRVLYEEVQCQAFEQEVVYSTQRTESYQLSFGFKRDRSYGRIVRGPLIMEINYEE